MAEAFRVMTERLRTEINMNSTAKVRASATVYKLDHFRKPKPMTPAQVRAWQQQNKVAA